ncbi:unnamed protein product [Cuscuta campestris]|uniref:Uncharacterized protein n=1 Tax=Cuscuta campestris TaxID=132261 RepID=A0A484LIC8_9ASTE|nr:unnamed protein product [Cuscuta campestris]
MLEGNCRNLNLLAGGRFPAVFTQVFADAGHGLGDAAAQYCFAVFDCLSVTLGPWRGSDVFGLRCHLHMLPPCSGLVYHTTALRCGVLEADTGARTWITILFYLDGLGCYIKTAMEIWQGLGKLCEGSQELRKQKIEVLLEKFKSFKMLPGESFDLLDERFHNILIIPTSENLFDKFKNMMEDFKEINLKHSSLTEENKLLSEENFMLTKGWKSQLCEITQLKAENKSLSEKVKSLNKDLGILKSKEAGDKLLETTKKKGREGLGFDPSSSKRKGRTTFIPPKPTVKPNEQKAYLEMIEAQELSEFLHLEILFKYEEEVQEFYRNGKIKTIQYKKNPQRTIL